MIILNMDKSLHLMAIMAICKEKNGDGSFAEGIIWSFKRKKRMGVVY